MNTLAVGVQSEGIVDDHDPLEGFEMMKRAGFSCCDFGLDTYFTDLSFCAKKSNDFFQQSVQELKNFFAPHKEAAEIAGIKINQMRVPYPLYIPNATEEKNDCLLQTVVSKSMEICAFFGCPYIVVYGFDNIRDFEEEELEREWTDKLLQSLAPMAKELKITICIKNNCINKGKHFIEGSCCDVEKVVMQIDSINEKYGAEILGFCFDTGHAKLLDIDCEDFITKLENRLKVLHIHDNDGRRNLHQIPFTFTGDCEYTSSTDWEGFVRGLRKIHFDKVLSFETALALSAFPGKMKQDVLRFMAQIGSYFVGEICNS